MCFASARHKGQDKLNGALFPVHKVNVSDSREIKDIKNIEIRSFVKYILSAKKRVSHIRRVVV